jgi:hypothetical protein
MKNLILFCVLFLIAFTAMAQVPQVPDEASVAVLGDLILNLIKNWKSLGVLGIASSSIVILITFLRSPLMGDWFGEQTAIIKRLVIVVLGQILSVLVMMIDGSVWYIAIIQGLFISGGAMLIWESIKPFIKKKSSFM